MSGTRGFPVGARRLVRRWPLWLALAATATLALGGAASGIAAHGSASSTIAAERGSHLPALSADGRFVAFISYASNLVPGDTNNQADVFVRDRVTGRTERVSVSSTGAQAGHGDDDSDAISADGRFVAFDSSASNLVPGDTNGGDDVFVRDRVAGTTERVDVSSTGAQANRLGSGGGTISADGRFVAFDSFASNLVPGDTNDKKDVFVRDRVAGTTQRVDVSSAGAQADSHAGTAAISADGRFVAFGSSASNLVAGDTNGHDDVFVRDRVAGTTELVDVSTSGEQAIGYGGFGAAISADGRFVAFDSYASNLVPGDTNGRLDEFVRDRAKGTTERVDVSSSGGQTNDGYDGPFSGGLSISSDGRFVAFDSFASNLVPGDTNGEADVFVRDRATGTTTRVTPPPPVGALIQRNRYPAVSADGHFVAFEVGTNSLCGCDSEDPDTTQVFVRDLAASTTSLVSVGHKWVPQAGRLLLHPRPARAGKRLTATVPILAGGGPAAAARIACAAAIAGRTLRAAGRSFVLGSSSARCVWQILAGTRGKALTGSVSATTQGGTATRRFVTRVR